MPNYSTTDTYQETRRAVAVQAAELLRNPDTFTLTYDQVAALLGVAPATAYREVRDNGTLGGVAVIRVGAGQRRRILLPAQPFREMLGVLVEYDQHNDAPDPAGL